MIPRLYETKTDLFDSQKKLSRRQNGLYPSNSSVALESLVDKGPLLTTAMALFGTGSYISARLLHPSAYEGVARGGNANLAPPRSNYTTCADLIPMSGLLRSVSRSLRRCIRYGDGDDNNLPVSAHLDDWVSGFRALVDEDVAYLSNAFTTAAFLANQAWFMTKTGRFSSNSVNVKIDSVPK